MSAVMRMVVPLLLLSVASFSGYAQSDKIVGTWLTEDEDGKIEIYEEGGLYFGKLIWGKGLVDENGDPVKDSQNPDESKRDEPVLNSIILNDFEYDKGSGTWEGGTVYNSRNGKTYKAYMKMKDDQLVLTGYFLVKALSKSTKWTRVGS